MRDFSIQEAIDIINSLDNTSEIRTTNHFNVINEFKSLKMITTYEAKSSRRIGENEYR